MKFCPECGTKLIGSEKFCSECGFNLGALGSSPAGNVPQAAASPPESGESDSVKLEPVEPSEAVAEAVRLGNNALRKGELENALTQFESALKEDPNNLEALLGKGDALLHLDKPEDALAIGEAVLAKDAENERALYLCAEGWFRIGQGQWEREHHGGAGA